LRLPFNSYNQQRPQTNPTPKSTPKTKQKKKISRKTHNNNQLKVANPQKLRKKNTLFF